MNNPCDDCHRNCDIPCWKVDHGLLVEPTRWIPVTERRPEIDEEVMVCCRNGLYHICEYSGMGVYHAYYPVGMKWYKVEEVTHWMPLPDGPKEVE